MKNIFFLILLCILVPSMAAAHGDSSSFEATSKLGFLVDVGYSSPPTALESSVFDFSVKDESGTDAPFDYIWVRLSRDSSTYLATGITKAPIGKTVLTYRFPEAGAYELAVRFEKEGKTVAEHTFPFEAKGAEGSQIPRSLGVLLSILAAFLLGGAATYFFFLRTR